jgi:predicted MFS family arabinose efflux permease
MIMAVVPSIGSAIGGYIMEYGRWELVFQFLAVLSFCLTIIYALLLPETNAYSGVARNNRFISVLKVAIKDKVLVSYAFIIGCFNGLCFGFYIQAPFILIDNLGMSPASYGSLFLMLSISSLLGSIVNRNLIKKYVSTFKIISSGFAISIISCICLLIGASYIDDSSDITLVSLVIFLPMSTHLMGHSMVVPMLLRHALEDYFKVTGSAGSIFGSLYYIMTALVILCISQLHSDTIDNYSYIYAVLMVLSSIVFYLSTSWKKQSVKPEF